MKNAQFKISGIGSLPHHNVDSAIEYVFRHDIPYLPQLPNKSKKEFMIYQALEHLPGILLNESNQVQVDLKKWPREKIKYEDNLQEALTSNNSSALLRFLPSSDVLSAWNPFLFELEERKISIAKIQMADPLTTQMALKLSDGETIHHYPELMSQITKTVICQALAQIGELKKRGVTPIIFLDGPGLYTLNLSDPYYKAAMFDINIAIQTFKKHGASVGLHCCSNTLWDEVLNLPWDYISIDVNLTLKNILTYREAIINFLERGGQIWPGIIPTSHNSQIEMPPMFDLVCQELLTFFKNDSANLKRMMEGMVLTPACGLAFRSGDSVENFFLQLKILKKRFSEFYNTI